MSAVVRFGDQTQAFEVDPSRLDAAFDGPPGLPIDRVVQAVHRALAEPDGFPGVGATVVPGDRVVLALGDRIPSAREVLAAVVSALALAGIGSGSITALAPSIPDGGWGAILPEGVAGIVHDADDPNANAYLAATSTERRIYLNRALVDADLVLPIAALGVDPVLGVAGPWSALFPGLAGTENLKAVPKPEAALVEATEVGWLLGVQLQLGLLPGVDGLAAALAGTGDTLRVAATAAIEASWTVRSPQRSAVVVAGVGGPGRAASIDDLARAMSTAAALCRRGGKIVVLSEVEGPIGPALSMLAANEGRSLPRDARGHDDHAAAHAIAEALAWADVYLLSKLDESTVEDLGIIALAAPAEAARLARVADSVTLVSHADRAGAQVSEE